ncbi:MAG: hypothetical protein GY804_03460 [Alphaproteobacteria bacterium]|nr:hypothetical protein [Alphaproteobacteria bacterium]
MREKKYAVLRRKEILENWPVHKQLEAITEDALGNSELFDELLDFIEDVKTEHPKETLYS